MTFNLEKCADELFGWHGYPEAVAGIQLAREALEAAAKECAAQSVRNPPGPLFDAGWNSWNMRGKVDADIIRRIANEKPGDSQAQPIGTQSRPCAGEGMSSAAPPALAVEAADMYVALSDAEILDDEHPAFERGWFARDRRAKDELARAKLSDAECLERAVEISRRENILEEDLNEILLENADRLHQPKLRAAEEVDVFEAFVRAWLKQDGHVTDKDHAREWFGPLVSALERIADPGIGECSAGIALDALGALHARARAQGGGR